MKFWMFLRSNRREFFDPRGRVLRTGTVYKYARSSLLDTKPMAYEFVTQAMENTPGSVLCRVELIDPVLLYGGGARGTGLKILASSTVDRWLHCVTFDAAVKVVDMLPDPTCEEEKDFHRVMKKALMAKEAWLEETQREPTTLSRLLWARNYCLATELSAYTQGYSIKGQTVAAYWLYYLAARAVNTLIVSGTDFDNEANQLKTLPHLARLARTYKERLMRGDEDNRLADFTVENAIEAEQEKEFSAAAFSLLERGSRYVEAA